MYSFTRFTSLIAPFALLATVSTAQAETSLETTLRFGLGFVDNDRISSDFRLESDESRVRLGHKSEIRSGMGVIANLDIELAPDNNSSTGNLGLGFVREAWVGLEGGFGQLTVGTQYSAFYDHVSGVSDIAWFGSCLTQLQCDEVTNVIKYNRDIGPIKLTSSLQAAQNDNGNDFVDELEVGASFETGPVSVGVATSIRTNEGDRDGGILIGGVGKAALGNLDLGVSLQLADSDYAGFGDTSTQLTLTTKYKGFYSLLNLANGLSDDSGNYGTLGYTHNISENALMYFETIVLDGGDTTGTNIILLAAFKYDFEVL